MPRSRAWVYTLFSTDGNPQVPDLPGNCQYHVFQYEVCPTTGKTHIQGYLYFQDAKSDKTLEKFLPGAYKQPRHGTHDEAREYSMKAATRAPAEDGYEPGPFEFGQPPAQGTRTELSLACQTAQEKGLQAAAQEYPETFVKFHRGLAALLVHTAPPPRVPPKVTVLIGSPGSGKTRYAYDLDPALYTPMIGNGMWFDGYDGQKTVLFDDFYGEIPYSFLLRLLDRYPLQVPIKGGSAHWTPTHIILTSNKEVTSWYADTAALSRRISEIIYKDLEPPQPRVTASLQDETDVEV